MLSLLGVVVTEHLFAMVSEWMSNGNIMEFVKARCDMNRFELVSILFDHWVPSPDIDQSHGYGSWWVLQRV